MIAKKNSRFDLERKRIVLFQIGLLTAGSFTLAAFNYTSTVKYEAEKQAVSFVPVTFELELKPEEPKKVKVVVKQPKQNKQQQSTTVKASAAVTQDVKASANTSKDVKPDLGLPPVGPIGDDDIIDINLDDFDPFPTVEAEYIGGYTAMMEKVQDVMVYPEVDIEMNVQGKVYISFIVEKDGSVSNVEIERGVSSTIDREAKRIVKSFPNWKPGENAYGKVRTRVRLPLNFVLSL